MKNLKQNSLDRISWEMECYYELLYCPMFNVNNTLISKAFLYRQKHYVLLALLEKPDTNWLHFGYNQNVTNL